MRPRRGHQPGITIGRGLCRERIAHSAARARTIIDDDGLAEFFRQMVRENARRDIRTAARRKADQKADGFGGIGLRECGH